MARNASRPTSIEERRPRLQIFNASSRSPALAINSRRPDPAPCANLPAQSGIRTRSASAITASGVISVTVLPRHLLRHLRGLTAEPHLDQVREAFEFSGPALRWLRAKGDGGLSSAEREESTRLRRENRRLKEEIL